jgi:hypothetical protein
MGGVPPDGPCRRTRRGPWRRAAPGARRGCRRGRRGRARRAGAAAVRTPPGTCAPAGACGPRATARRAAAGARATAAPEAAPPPRAAAVTPVPASTTPPGSPARPPLAGRRAGRRALGRSVARREGKGRRGGGGRGSVPDSYMPRYICNQVLVDGSKSAGRQRQASFCSGFLNSDDWAKDLHSTVGFQQSGPGVAWDNFWRK